MFLELDKKDQNKIAIIDSEGNQCSYGQILEFASQFYEIIHKRTLIFILNDNSAGAAMGYLGAVSSHVVPLMLGASMDKELMERLIAIYQRNISGNQRIWQASGNRFYSKNISISLCLQVPKVIPCIMSCRCF